MAAISSSSFEVATGMLECIHSKCNDHTWLESITTIGLGTILESFWQPGCEFVSKELVY